MSISLLLAWLAAYSAVVRAAAVSQSSLPHGVLPSPATFASQNGTKWTVQSMSNIQFMGKLGEEQLGGDKCRTSVLGGKVIWNCGDMDCAKSPDVCGFCMGPAFYGTDSVLSINSSAYDNIQEYLFAAPWSGDPAPQSPYTSWGMDTSNVAPVNDTHGIAFAWEIWRGGPNPNPSNRGLAVVSVTLGLDKPIATRMGPLTTNGSAVQMGDIAIQTIGDYIYSYSAAGPSAVVVGRVPKDGNDPFSASNHEFLEYNADPAATPVWIKGGIPAQNSTQFGAATEAGGAFACSHYGSVFYNNYFQQYMLVCGINEWAMNFYVSNNPWGPWNGSYPLLRGVHGYGTMAHPEFSPGGSHKTLYISQGPNGPFNMFNFTFNY